MTILDIELVHFGKFHRKKIRFAEGLNVVYGKNEAGKSTIHTFIRCMFFGMNFENEKKRTLCYEKYFPWDDLGGYGGKMRISKDGHVYRIERNFLAGEESVHLYDETLETELFPAEARLKALTEGLTEVNYDNTISIEQLKNITDPKVITELEHYIYNTSSSKNVTVDLEKAKQKLEAKKAAFEAHIKENDAKMLDQVEAQLAKKKQDYALQRDRLAEKQSRLSSLVQEEQSAYRKEEEESLAYERQLEICRRQYEAAKRNWENAPNSEGNASRRKMLSGVFAIIAGLLLMAIGYLVVVGALEEQTGLIAAAGLSAAAVLCGIGFVMSIITAKRKKQILKKEKEINALLRQQLDESIEAFEQCRELSNGNSGRYEEIKAEQERVAEEIRILENRAYEKKEIYEEALIEHQKICASMADDRYLTQELDAVNLSLSVLDEITERVKETFGNRLCKEAGAILSRITKDRYDRIVIDADRTVKIGNTDEMFPLRNISHGTVEQVYFSIRIAAAQLLWQKSPMPFIFDDVFAYYDDERLASAMELLKACGHQAIIFTCNTREDQMMEEM